MDSREQQTIRMENVKRTLSTLWIFVTLNYLYCDVVSLIDPGQLKQYIAGHVNGIGECPFTGLRDTPAPRWLSF